MPDATRAVETGATGAYGDSVMGTWEADVGSSSFSGPAPRSHTRTYEPVGAGYRLVVEGIASDGQQIAWEYTANYDGQDYPVTGAKEVDSIALSQVDDLTTLGVFKKDGKVVALYYRGMDAGGDKLTITTAGANSGGGEPYFDITEYRKRRD